MTVYEVLISGSVTVKADNEGDAIEEALSIGAPLYRAEIIDAYDEEE